MSLIFLFFANNKKFFMLNLFFIGSICSMHTSIYAISNASIAMEAPIHFGTYQPYSRKNNDSVGRVQVNCAGNDALNYQVTVLGGKKAKNGLRYMTNGKSILYYDLYVDAARLIPLGEGEVSTNTIQGSQTCAYGSSFQHVVYARIPAGQSNISPGIYSDTLTVTINY